jgi:hypothetical protein
MMRINAIIQNKIRLHFERGKKACNQESEKRWQPRQLDEQQEGWMKQNQSQRRKQDRKLSGGVIEGKALGRIPTYIDA